MIGYGADRRVYRSTDPRRACHITGCLPLQGGLSAAPARAVSAVKNMNLPEMPRNINIGDLNIKVPSLSPFWAGPTYDLPTVT